MPLLLETQERFAQAVLGNSDAALMIVENWLKPEQRIGIYRNHYKATLREALALTFPVVFKLVGEAFFNSMVDHFIDACPPSQPCIAEYGSDFPGFIAGFEPAGPLPYLSDVAMFEWLLNEAAQAFDYDGRMFYSRYPIGHIWEVNQPDAVSDDVVHLDEGGGWLVVEKNRNGVYWRMVDLPPDAFSHEVAGHQ